MGFSRWVLICIVTITVGKAYGRWSDEVRKLGQSQSLRSSALKHLREMPHRDSRLLAALSGEDRALALEAIGALQLHELADDLLTESGRDPDGFLILTLNSLLTKSNSPHILRSYVRDLIFRREHLSAGAVVALLEPLGRLGWALPQDVLLDLLHHPFPEVQSSVLNYIRTRALKQGQWDLLHLTDSGLPWASVQVRRQLLFLRAEASRLRELRPLSTIDLPWRRQDPTSESAAVKTVKIRIVFGYKDTRPDRFVGDRHERLAFVQRILSPCRGPHKACGFVRDREDADLFRRLVLSSTGKWVQVQMRVVHSSVDSDDRSNRKNPFQVWQSSYAEKTFLDGLNKADVLFYNGHSRYGGGPDFQGPILTSAGEIDLSYYRKERPGLRKLKQAILQTRATGNGTLPRIIGLFSCSSNLHFVNQMKKIMPGSSTRWISTSSVIHYSEALAASLDSLSSYLRSLSIKQGPDIIATVKR